MDCSILACGAESDVEKFQIVLISTSRISFNNVARDRHRGAVYLRTKTKSRVAWEITCVLIDGEGKFVRVVKHTQLPVVSAHRRLLPGKRNKSAVDRRPRTGDGDPR
jgi:hypothetical protein